MEKKLKKTIIAATFIIGSFCLNGVSFFLHLKTDFLSPTKITSIATSFWLMSLILFALGLLILNKNNIKKVDQNQSLKLSSVEYIFLLIILLIGLILRLYKITHQGIYLDEWYWLTNAKQILNGIIRSPFGFIGDQPSNMPAYIVAIFLFIFKNSYLAVRLPGVMYSLANIFFVFYFLREAFGKKVAFISSLLLALSIWDIHMSQLGWNNVNLNPFIISAFLYFLFKGLKHRSLINLFLCGFFLGMSINLLYIAALNLIVLLIYIFYQLFISKNKKQVIFFFLVVIVSTWLSCSPTIPKIIKYRMQSLGRHEEFIKKNVSYSKVNKGILFYFDQIKTVIEDFKYNGQKYQIVGLWGITLEPLIIFLFIVGLIYSFGRPLHPAIFLILLNFFVMFIPMVLLNRTTSVWREYGFLPTIYMIAALGTFSLLKLISKNNYSKIFLLFLTIFYLLYWGYFFSKYYKSSLIKEPANYETGCKKNAYYITNNLSTKTLILLPDELCQQLIEVFIWDKYRYKSYDDYQMILEQKKKNDNIAVIKIYNSFYSSKFNQVNPISTFELNLRKRYPNLSRKEIYDEKNQIFSVIYQL